MIKELNKKTILKKLFLYLLGVALIGVSVNLFKISSLGMTPVTSLPYALEKIWGFTLGTTTMISYIVFVFIQVLILRKDFPIRNVLGLVLTFWLSFMIDLTGIDPKALGHLMIGLPIPQAYPARLLYFAVGIIVGAAGVFLYIYVNWAPLPTDGCAAAIAKITGRQFGDCKTLVDTAIVLTSLILQLVFLGGFASFTNGNAVVREGTILAAIFIGQAVKPFTKWFGPKIDAWTAGEKSKTSNSYY